MICARCHKPIIGTFYKDQGKAYHEKCFLDHKNLYCVVCGKPIKGRYIYDAWGNKAHAYHDIQYCHSCFRIISDLTGSALRHRDGRRICNDCIKTAVTESFQVEEARNHVTNLLAMAGFTGMPSDIDIELVHKRKMKKLSGSDTYKGLANIITRVGLMKKTIVSKKIFILDYLPEIHFKGILAHEMLHIWLAVNNISLGKNEEALCNIGSTLVYNTMKKYKLARILNDNMKIDSDPYYGVRFIKLKEKLKAVGWKRFVNDIKASKS